MPFSMEGSPSDTDPKRWYTVYSVASEKFPSGKGWVWHRAGRTCEPVISETEAWRLAGEHLKQVPIGMDFFRT